MLDWDLQIALLFNFHYAKSAVNRRFDLMGSLFQKLYITW